MNTHGKLAERLFEVRSVHHEGFPSRHDSEQFLVELSEMLFPQLCRKKESLSVSEITGVLSRFHRQLITLLDPVKNKMERSPDEIGDRFFDRLPEVYDLLWEDARAIDSGDPAAESLDEVIAAYPGFYSIMAYRIAHVFHIDGVPVFPRLLTEFAHRRTGVDIHPGATIGRSFCIDHATGIVIGQTCVIGNNVKIYQGVTLGALSVAKDLSNSKRHPTIEDNVVIYSNATILGGNTTIGHHSIIGGNAWLTHSVDPYSVVYNTAEISIRTKPDEPQEVMFHI